MLFEKLKEFRHEQVLFTYLHDVNLKAIIAIHDTTLGPALGGLRMYPYESEEEAVYDVLRLARGMTYKAAAAGLNLGGGKAVIIGDPKQHKSEMLFRAFGKAVDSLGGRYITAEDVGTDPLDMEFISQETRHVTGLDRTRGGSGDPSPMTAAGVVEGMRAALQWKFDSQSLKGRAVALQGLGHVGAHLARLLVEAGAKVYATDIDRDRCDAIKAELPSVDIVHPDEILFVECDVLAPCALGGVVNDDTIDRLRTRVVCGPANNQLAEQRHGAELAQRGILYAPDYVVNAGGLMNVYVELEGYSEERAYRLIRSIYHNTLRILQLASQDSVPTSEAADRFAVERMHQIARLRVCINRFHTPQQTQFRPM
jgi:leucine dehydrogenase